MTMCPRCEALQEENAFLKRELGLRVDEERVVRLQNAFQLTRSESHVVLTLYQSRNFSTPKGILADALPALNGERQWDIGSLRVAVRRIRIKRGDDFIRTLYAFGYRLSEQAASQVAGALA